MTNASVAAFADVEANRARELAEKHGARAYSRFEEMLDKERLDAVLLCTPHHTRRAPIEAVAARGLALFCEKPPAFTLEAARTGIEAIEKAGILNTVGLMYRWAEITDKVREWIGDKKVSVCQITGCWSVIYWIKPGGGNEWFLKQDQSGGPMMEQGIHLLDAARYILQDDVVEVHAFGSNYVEPRSERLTIHDTVLAGFVRAVAARDQRMLRCTYADACKSFAATHAAVQSALTGLVQRVEP